MYDTLDEVPWNSVTSVTGPSGNTVGLNSDGFAVCLTGPRSGQRIPLDAHGPWHDERKCPHGYGIKQGPCPVCDSVDDIRYK